MRHKHAACALLIVALGAVISCAPSKEAPPGLAVPVASALDMPTSSTTPSFVMAPVTPAAPAIPPGPSTPGTPGTTTSSPATTAPARNAPPPQKAPPPPVLATPNASGKISFYSAKDNEPPGSRQIAFTTVLHGQAGGTGTFDDPLTYSARPGQRPPGTKIYVPDVSRYFILEDSCSSCSDNQVDLWTGSSTDNGILDCEGSLTRNGSRPYQVNPPPGLPVVPGDLYQNGRCYKP
jgi:hypothetical protein